MTKKFKLFMGHLGNGLTVCNSAAYEDGDYKKICHISDYGHIKWYVKPEYIPADSLIKIEHQADIMQANFHSKLTKHDPYKQYEILAHYAGFASELEAMKLNTIRDRIIYLTSVLKTKHA